MYFSNNTYIHVYANEANRNNSIETWEITQKKTKDTKRENFKNEKERKRENSIRRIHFEENDTNKNFLSPFLYVILFVFFLLLLTKSY